MRQKRLRTTEPGRCLTNSRTMARERKILGTNGYSVCTICVSFLWSRI